MPFYSVSVKSKLFFRLFSILSRLLPHGLFIYWPPLRQKVLIGRRSLSNYYEVFIHENYRPIEPLPRQAVILDLGGYIGFSALDFRRRYPQATLAVVEANPVALPWISAHLSAYLGSPIPDHTQIIHRAVSPSSSTVDFWVPTDDPVNVVAHRGRHPDNVRKVGFNKIQVQGAPLSELLDMAPINGQTVDLAKIDIEGSEYECLQEACVNPRQIRQMVVEFHDIAQQAERFQTTLMKLIARGYRLHDEQRQAVNEPESWLQQVMQQRPIALTLFFTPLMESPG